MSRIGAVLASVGVLALGSCSAEVDGEAVSSLNNPFLVAGLAVTDGPNGLHQTPRHRPGSR